MSRNAQHDEQSAPGLEVSWWRERDREVDFVLSDGARTLPIQVTGGRRKTSVPGIAEFMKRFPEARPLLVGGQGWPLMEALSRPAGEWLS